MKIFKSYVKFISSQHALFNFKQAVKSVVRKMSKWPLEEIENLINLVKLRPILYGKSLRGYRNDMAKVNTWVEVANMMGKPGKFSY